MAGDWIKMRCELQTHPKIVRILSSMRPHDIQTRTDKFRVIGGLHAVWSVFDTHSVDGVLFGYTPETLDHVIGLEGFAEAMIAVEWLFYDGAQTLSLPEFAEHNGQSAKRRAEDQKRKRNGRKEDKCPQSVRNLSAEEQDKSPPESGLEKRREDIEQPRAPRFDAQSHLESLGVDAQVAKDWITHRKAKRAAPTETAIDGIAREAEKAGVSLQSALTISCQRGWQGFNADWMKSGSNGRMNGHTDNPFA
ncbi:hypothetical protein [Paraburkholderia phenoliruptrix]|uniref:hypothetical protein n=1 Tax=Paraburkholderia phenoliruptrix TaxID=252970 RepID=UPI002861B8FD|nr:hypothetical protein [Paraburkholderia phenoliruptrix]MDR6393033.1 hypothetical protein [Paraburkholderia phenoliruptrix]